MPYRLKRTRDGAGDSGAMSLGIRFVNGKLEQIDNFKPRVGFAIRVGSIIARSYSAQDWWQTTYITEILEDRGDYVKFRTGNSEYEWERF